MKEQRRKGDEVRGCGRKGGAPGEWRRGGAARGQNRVEVLFPPCHGTIVGAEELLVMEFINSVHDRLSWGGHNIVQFCMFHAQKGAFKGLF